MDTAVGVGAVVVNVDGLDEVRVDFPWRGKILGSEFFLYNLSFKSYL